MPRESGYYPPGAEFDPRAPWKQKDCCEECTRPNDATEGEHCYNCDPEAEPGVPPEEDCKDCACHTDSHDCRDDGGDSNRCKCHMSSEELQSIHKMDRYDEDRHER